MTPPDNAPSPGIPFPGKSHVRFHGDVVIKSGAAEQLRIEVAKTEMAHQIGNECGLFCVPKIRDFDESNGSVVFERISGLQRLAETIAFRKDTQPLVARIAASLAEIHQKLRLPDEMKIGLANGVAGPAPRVFLHGDYSLDNVCLSADRNSLVILDWQASGLHGGCATYGTCFFDLAWFLTNLFYLRSRGLRYLGSSPVSGLADAFVESYLARMSMLHATDAMVAYLQQFFTAMVSVRRKNFRWRRRICLAFMLPSYQRFIRTLPSRHRIGGEGRREH